MEKRKDNPEVEIDILPIFKQLLSKLWLIVIVGLVFAGIAFGATKVLIKPTYRSSFTAYVNNKHTQGSTESLTQSDLTAAKQLVSTYTRIIRSNTILTAAAETVHFDYSFSQLQKMVTAEIQGDTEIISVHVTSQDPETAYIFANAIVKTAPKYMTEIVEGSSMKIIDYPMYSDKRYKPNYFNYALLGFAFGALLVIIKVLVDYFKDDKISDEFELERRFDLPMLGVIPDVLESHEANMKGGYYEYQSSNQVRNTKKG